MILIIEKLGLLLSSVFAITTLHHDLVFVFYIIFCIWNKKLMACSIIQLDKDGHYIALDIMRCAVIYDKHATSILFAMSCPVRKPENCYIVED